MRLKGDGMMRYTQFFVAAASCALLAACGGSNDAAPASSEAAGGGSGGGASSAGAGGGAITGSERNRMVEACLASTNNERPMCECVADQGRDELTPLGFRMLLASFEGDQVTAAQLRTQLSPQEAAMAGGFAVNAFAQCARGMSGG